MVLLCTISQCNWICLVPYYLALVGFFPLALRSLWCVSWAEYTKPKGCALRYACNSLSSSSCRFAHLRWTRAVKDSRSVRKCLWLYFVESVLSGGSRGYLYFQSNTRVLVRRYICNSFYLHHQIGSIKLISLLSYFPVVVCLKWLYHLGFVLYQCVVLWCAQIIEYMMVR